MMFHLVAELKTRSLVGSYCVGEMVFHSAAELKTRSLVGSYCVGTLW